MMHYRTRAGRVAAATGDLCPAPTPTAVSRKGLDVLARRAGLPMGQRLRLRTAIPEVD